MPKKFILLLNHDDISLSAYLQHLMDRGERFVRCSGNDFTFRKEKPSGKRIAAVTFFNNDPHMKMQFQIEDYAFLMKKKGWQVIHAGKPEDIFDSRRHVFLETDQQDIPFPETDKELAKKAQKREIRSLIRCAAMLLVLLGFSIFFLSHDPDIFLSSLHILIPCAVGFILWLISCIYSIRGAGVLRKKSQCADGFRNFLVVDKAVLFCMAAVGALLAALLLDLWIIPNSPQTVVTGEQRVVFYRDPVPLTLDMLGIPAEGKFRSRRLTERTGPLMQSCYGFDQSFSDPSGTADLSLITYSVYQSDWKSGLDWVENRKGYGSYSVSDDLAEAWHSLRVHSDGIHRLSARYPGALIIFSTSADIRTLDPDLILQALLPSVLQ